jgi:hypothetical protein
MKRDHVYFDDRLMRRRDWAPLVIAIAMSLAAMTYAVLADAGVLQ